MPGLLSIFRAPPLRVETEDGPALPPVPVKGAATPMPADDAAGPALPPAPAADRPEAPVLPPKQSLFARRAVEPVSGDGTTAGTIDETRPGLPAVKTGKKGKKGSSETLQEVAVMDAQAASPQTVHPAGAQNIVVNVTTAPAVVPHWGWVGCGSRSCPYRRGLVCRSWWCW
jgi:hypothetical protein